MKECMHKPVVVSYTAARNIGSNNKLFNHNNIYHERTLNQLWYQCKQLKSITAATQLVNRYCKFRLAMSIKTVQNSCNAY